MTTNCCFSHLSLGDEEILEWIVNDFSEFNKIRPMDIGEIKMDNLADELVDIDIDVVKDYFTEEAWNAIKQSVDGLKKEWQCQECLVAKHKNMIECDVCYSWYHW